MIDASIKKMIEEEFYMDIDTIIVALNKINYNRNDDTANYILENFGSLLKNMSISNFLKFFNDISKRKDYLQRLVLKKFNIYMEDFINLINQCNKNQIKRIDYYITNLEDAEILFSGKFEQFYNNVDKNKLDFENIFAYNYRIKSKMRNEYMEVLNNAFQNGNLSPSVVYWYIRELISDGIDNKILHQYMGDLIQLTDSPIKTLTLLSNCKIDLTGMEKIINTKIDSVVKEMLGFNRPNLEVNKYMGQERKEIEETTKIFLQDVLKNENCNICDIKWKGEGSYNTVYSIGSKIIKVGNKPGVYKIPRNSKRFLKHLVRFFDERKCIEKMSSISIAELCDISQEVSKEELYQIYKDVRKDGMIWSDAKPENVGRLLRDNKVYFDGIDEVFYKNLGFQEDNEVEVLKKR